MTCAYHTMRSASSSSRTSLVPNGASLTTACVLCLPSSPVSCASPTGRRPILLQSFTRRDMRPSSHPQSVLQLAMMTMRLQLPPRRTVWQRQPAGSTTCSPCHCGRSRARRSSSSAPSATLRSKSSRSSSSPHRASCGSVTSTPLRRASLNGRRRSRSPPMRHVGMRPKARPAARRIVVPSRERARRRPVLRWMLIPTQTMTTFLSGRSLRKSARLQMHLRQRRRALQRHCRRPHHCRCMNGRSARYPRHRRRSLRPHLGRVRLP
mmetsp:Transcript_5168/g.16433  ORF Transcript_5168/g.16433 Transcript_5168/m.16433 type:complete len:265 (+) Transcript_5168:592-1386(+)